jgi:hypothetical protein
MVGGTDGPIPAHRFLAEQEWIAIRDPKRHTLLVQRPSATLADASTSDHADRRKRNGISYLPSLS